MHEIWMKDLAEILFGPLLASLLLLDLWTSAPRRARIATASTAVVLFVAFFALVVTRFVIVAR